MTTTCTATMVPAHQLASPFLNSFSLNHHSYLALLPLWGLPIRGPPFPPETSPKNTETVTCPPGPTTIRSHEHPGPLDPKPSSRPMLTSWQVQVSDPFATQPMLGNSWTAKAGSSLRSPTITLRLSASSSPRRRCPRSPQRLAMPFKRLHSSLRRTSSIPVPRPFLKP